MARGLLFLFAIGSKNFMREAGLSEIAREILNYLLKNPDARDTLEGVVQWWLPEQEIKRRTAAIKEALDELVDAGLLSERKGKDAQISYSITSQGLQIPEENTEPGGRRVRLVGVSVSGLCDTPDVPQEALALLPATCVRANSPAMTPGSPL